MSKSKFAGHQRSRDGIIVTFARGDKRWTRHFYQAVIEQGRHTGQRRIVRLGERSILQAIRHADDNDALIATISNPETIYRDLSGTRYESGPNNDIILFPERIMLGAERRLDLWLQPEPPRMLAA